MSHQPRGKACDNCRALKIKCELGTSQLPPPCARCKRLVKDCSINTTRTRRDRIAELEAKVDALTLLLESHGLKDLRPTHGHDSSGRTAKDGAGDEPDASVQINGPRSAGRGQKRRRTKALSAAGASDRESFGSARQFAAGHNSLSACAVMLGDLVSLEQQERILGRYVNEIAPAMPLVPASRDWTLESLHSSKPGLFLAIIYAAGPGVLSAESEARIAEMVFNDAARRTIGERERSLELVQALQIASLHCRPARSHKHFGGYQLMQLANNMALEIGISGSRTLQMVASSECKYSGDIDSPEAWRSWLTCFVISSAMHTSLRSAKLQAWTQHHEHCLERLQLNPRALKSDRLLCQIVRAERLCDKVAGEMAFDDLTNTRDVCDPPTRAIMHSLQDELQLWQDRIPRELRLPKLLFWKHVAVLYLHETVLHTKSNKESFSAPYLPDQLIATDFAAPCDASASVSSLHALKDSAHALLDIILALPTQEYLMLPPLLYAIRSAYAVFILLKMHITVTAKGNTFGEFISPEEVRVEHYLERLIGHYTKICQLDSSDGAACISTVAESMLEWFEQHSALFQRTQAAQSIKEPVETAESASIDLAAPDVYGIISENELNSFDWAGFVNMPQDDFWFGN